MSTPTTPEDVLSTASARYGRLIRSVIRERRPSFTEDDVADVFQDALIRAWAGRANLPKSAKAIKQWFRTIAGNAAAKYNPGVIPPDVVLWPAGPRSSVGCNGGRRVLPCPDLTDYDRRTGS